MFVSLIQRRLINIVRQVRHPIPIIQIQRPMSICRLIEPHENDRDYDEYDPTAINQSEIEEEWEEAIDTMGGDDWYGMRKEAIKRKEWLPNKKRNTLRMRSIRKVEAVIDLIHMERAINPSSMDYKKKKARRSGVRKFT